MIKNNMFLLKRVHDVAREHDITSVHDLNELVTVGEPMIDGCHDWYGANKDDLSLHLYAWHFMYDHELTLQLLCIHKDLLTLQHIDIMSNRSSYTWEVIKRIDIGWSEFCDTEYIKAFL